MLKLLKVQNGYKKMGIKKLLKDIFEDTKIEKFNKILIEEGLNYKITRIHYFRPDGKDNFPSGDCYFNGAMLSQIQKNENSFKSVGMDYEPGGPYSARGWMMGQIHANEKTFGSVLNESYSNQYGFKKYKGGIIVFSTSLNKVLDNKDLSKITTLTEKIYYTLAKKINKKSKIYKVVNNWNINFENNFDCYNDRLSIGHNFTGSYTDNFYQRYSKKSTTLEVGFAPSELLMLVATEMCRVFKQISILLKDFNTNKIYKITSNVVQQNTVK